MGGGGGFLLSSRILGETGVIAGLVGIVKHIVVTKGDGTHVVPPCELA